jgi:hypothetical protein
VALGLFALGRRNQIVQGSASVVGELGEKPRRSLLAGLVLVQRVSYQPQADELTLWLLPLSIHAS